jgi:hypothetical protein
MTVNTVHKLSCTHVCTSQTGLALRQSDRTGIGDQSDMTGQGFWKSQRTGHDGQLFLGRRTTYNCNFLTGSATKVNHTCAHAVCT